MERIIKQKICSELLFKKKKRVAAYARVSSGKDAMLHSLSAQVSYYNTLIQNNPEWEFAGIYADEAITGTRDTRENFLLLLEECKKGNIDMIITKSISRFARNTLLLLQTVRELKELGIDVYFEEQNIHSRSASGELMLTILASFAQEESYSVSENMKWRVRHNFEEGKPWNYVMYGYRNYGGYLAIEPDEARVIKDIYEMFLSGMGFEAIAKHLNKERILTRHGKAWRKENIKSVLQNYAHTGNIILQSTFVDNHLTKRKVINTGQKPKYMVKNSHEPIITMAEYEAVQKEIQRRASKYSPPGKQKQTYPFSGIVECAKCGAKYRRKTTPTQNIWICSTYNTKGKSACSSKAVPENTLYDVSCEVLGIKTFDEKLFAEMIKAIKVKDNNTLVFVFTDGHQTSVQWKDRSRSESWTAEMRAEAHRKEMERQAQINGK